MRPWEGLQPSFDTKGSGNADPVRFLGSVAFINITYLPVRELNRARFLAAFPNRLQPSLPITFSLSSFQETQVWTSENNYVTPFQKNPPGGLRVWKHVLSICEAWVPSGYPNNNKTLLVLGIKSKYRKADVYRTLKIREIFDICR